MTEETANITDLDPCWRAPVTDSASWWKRTGQGTAETLRVLLSIQPGEQPCARVVYRRVIRRLGPAIGNGYHDFEGPLAALRRLGLVEVVHERRPAPGELSPSCVGPGTANVPKGSPITWTVELTGLGVAVRAWWEHRDPYTGQLRQRPTADASAPARDSTSAPVDVASVVAEVDAALGLPPRAFPNE